MSVVLRLEPDAALQAAPLAGDAVPGVLPPEPALLDWASLTPVADSHLVPCPQCGLPNGLSAASCWNCEAALLPLERLRRGRAPWLATPAAAHADESLPVLTSAVQGADPTGAVSMAAVPLSAPLRVPAVGGRRRTWEMGALLLVVAAGVAVGAFLYLDTPAPASTATSRGFVDAMEPAAATPPAIAEIRTAALRALAVESAAPATASIDAAARRSAAQPAGTAPWKAAHAGRARGALRAPNAAVRAVPKPDSTDSSREPSSAARPCTSTVAALGLCTAPPTQSKE